MDKGLAIKAGAAVASASVIAGGGYLIYDQTNPTLYKKLISKGYKWEPASHKSIKIKESHYLTTTKAQEDFLLTNKSCVKNFFPGLPEFNVHNESLNITEEPSAIKPEIKDQEDLGIGCLIFSVENSSNNTVAQGISNWELTLKKGDFGVLINGYLQASALSKNESSDNLNYLWNFVQVKKEKDKWIPIAGISWNDALYSSSPASIRMTVNFPTQNAHSWNSGFSECKPDGVPKTEKYSVCEDISNWKIHSFSALWEENLDQAKEGQGIFDLVDIKDVNNYQSDVWGRKVFPFESDNSSYKGGWSVANIVLDTSDNIWKTHSENKSGKLETKFFDGTNFLKESFSPFENKKGTWTDIEDYCSSRSNIRSSNENFETTKFKSICMSREN